MKAELRPVCPACRGALSGDLVASKCNHIFHRACFDAAVDNPCPKCGAGDLGCDHLKLYGINFGKERAVDASVVAAALAAAAEVSHCEGGSAQPRELEDVSVLEGGVDAEVASIVELITLRERAKSYRQQLEALEAEAATAKSEAERQREKRLLAEKLHAKREVEIRDRAAEVEKCEIHYAEMCEQVQRNRDREAVYEYRDLLVAGKEADALKYLVTTVNLLEDPALVLTEIARLRDHHRTNLAKQQRENVIVSKRESKARRDLEDQQRTVGKLQSKLRRCGSRGATASETSGLRSQDSAASLDGQML